MTNKYTTLNVYCDTRKMIKKVHGLIHAKDQNITIADIVNRLVTEEITINDLWEEAKKMETKSTEKRKREGYTTISIKTETKKLINRCIGAKTMRLEKLSQADLIHEIVSAYAEPLIKETEEWLKEEDI